MGQFLFFVECERGALGSADAPEVMGLLLEPVTRGLSEGPNGRRGVLVTEANCPPARARVDVKRQVWVRRGTVVGLGDVYTGMWSDWVPGPEDLQRRRPLVAELASRYVAFPGAGRWLVPMVMEGTGKSRLPRAVELGPEGELVWVPLRGLESWEERGKRVWETAMVMLGLRPNEAPVLNAAELLGFVHEGLAVFYRVGRVEINLMQLLPGEMFLAFAFAMVGVDLLEQARAVREGVAVGK